MGMPVAIEIVEHQNITQDQVKLAIELAFEYLEKIDQKFSTYKDHSEVSKFNAGKISPEQISPEFAEVLKLSEQTKRQTQGYFDIFHDGKCDPSGLVKGWAINNTANLLKEKGFKNFYVDVGSDIQTCGKNSKAEKWTVGIRNPFDQNEIVKILEIEDKGAATSGTYIRGQHIYNPKESGALTEIVSLTVVGPDIYEADRFATAAFAMGKSGIIFLEKLPGFEAYMIDKNAVATMTSGLTQYLKSV